VGFLLSIEELDPHGVTKDPFWGFVIDVEELDEAEEGQPPYSFGYTVRLPSNMLADLAKRYGIKKGQYQVEPFDAG
jgi:hypothetical protein